MLVVGTTCVSASTSSSDLLRRGHDVLVVGKQHRRTGAPVFFDGPGEVGGARVLALPALDHHRAHLLEESRLPSPRLAATTPRSGCRHLPAPCSRERTWASMSSTFTPARRPKPPA